MITLKSVGLVDGGCEFRVDFRGKTLGYIVENGNGGSYPWTAHSNGFDWHGLPVLADCMSVVDALREIEERHGLTGSAWKYI